jgi:hypothetical protein|tara:strand:- start:447 stop:602 length:156 start_codon:yes stop_codon:yes gene_type:complete
MVTGLDKLIIGNCYLDKNNQDQLKLFPFELPGHYTVKGYRKITEAIYKDIF